MRVKSILQRVFVRSVLFTAGIVGFTALSGVDGLKAESAESKQNETGFVWVETFQGSFNTLGAVTKLDNAGGYKFSRLFQIDVGVPFYFVRASSTSTAQGLSSVNGMGDPYLGLRFTLGNSATTFVSSITGTIPVADTAKGLSTGRATVDWNNYLEFTAGSFSPFVDVGLANSISDTRFFTRPFTSLGAVAHFEGGTYVHIWHPLSLGASVYADAPFGEQKVFSKLIRRGQSGSPGQGRGAAKKGVFETESVTVGDAGIARDHGGSIWLDFYPGRFAGFQVGFSRSAEYDLNSVFFGVVLDVGKSVRSLD